MLSNRKSFFYHTIYRLKDKEDINLLDTVYIKKTKGIHNKVTFTITERLL